MQLDTKLPLWADGADPISTELLEETASPAVVVPFPSGRIAKKGRDPEIAAAIAAIDARKRTIKRNADDDHDDDDHPDRRRATILHQHAESTKSRCPSSPGKGSSTPYSLGNRI